MSSGLSSPLDKAKKYFEENAPPKKPSMPLTAAPPPPPAPPPRRELGPLPTLKKTAVDAVKLDRTGVNQQFDLNRQKAAQTEGAALQQSRDAMARRAAQLGGGPGGALIKAEQLAANESTARLQGANREIDAAKDAEMRRMGELETQLTLQKEEAQAARDLDIWKTDLSNALTKYGLDVQSDQWAADFGMKQDAQKFLEGQTGYENKENVRTNIISTIISLKNSGIPPDQVGGILKSIGYDYESLGIDPSAITGVQGLTEKAPEAPKRGSSDATAGVVGKLKADPSGRQGVYVDEAGNFYNYRNGKLQPVRRAF